MVAAIAYFWYLNRLYNTTYKPQLIPGIPAIPIAHPIHGHYGIVSLNFNSFSYAYYCV